METVIWYKVYKMFPQPYIYPVEVVSETSKFIRLLVSGQGFFKEAKVSAYCEYHPTWESAYTALLTIAEENVKQTSQKAIKAQEVLTDVLALLSAQGQGETCQATHCQDCERADEHTPYSEHGSTKHCVGQCKSY